MREIATCLPESGIRTLIGGRSGAHRTEIMPYVLRLRRDVVGMFALRTSTATKLQYNSRIACKWKGERDAALCSMLRITMNDFVFLCQIYALFLFKIIIIMCWHFIVLL